MATYRTTVTTATPVDVAFEYLARFSTTAEWDPGVVTAEDLTPGDLRVGSAFQVVSAMGPARVPLRYEIVALERPVRVVLRAENWAVTSTDTISFATTGGGSTEVDYHADLQPRGVTRLAAPLLSVAFRRIGDRAAAGLREALDRLAASPRPNLTVSMTTFATPPSSPLAEVADAALEMTIVGSFSRVGYLARRRLFHWDDIPADRLAGRTALVTGATSGLGRAAAQGLARAGATVVVLGRDPARTDGAATEIARATGRDTRVAIADLSRLADVRRVADELTATLDRLDVVVHNAGTLVHDLETTEDGIELTAQTHVVAPFLLTALLVPLLEDGDGGRVVTVTSGGMYSTALDLDALQDPPGGEDFDGVRAYARAKRAQVVLTREWAARTRGSGLSFHAMHPGWADTEGLAASLPHFHRMVRPILRSPEQGVDTTVWLAGADEPLAHDGALWLDRHRRRTTYLPGTGTSPAEAEALWAWCTQRSGITP